MPAQSIQKIIGTALTDASFCRGLLHGSRGQLLKSFDLSRQEFDALMSFRADSLQQFAGQAHEFLLQIEALHEFSTLPHLKSTRVRGDVRERAGFGTSRW